MREVLGVPIPDALVRLTKYGDGAARWLDGLPDLVDALIDRWRLTADLPLRPDGQCALVVPVTRREDGERCVLKVQWPHPEMEHEADALRCYDGDGAVRLVDEDPEDAALLLERCDPGTPAWEADDVIDVCTRAMRRLWRPVPDGHPFDDAALGIDRPAAIRRAFVEHGRPFESDLCEAGARMFEELTASAPRDVLLHGDFHPSNVLRARREPWLAIDPKPLVGDPAFDTAQLILNFHGAWPTGHRLDRPIRDVLGDVARALDVDVERVWGWTFARTVEEITWALNDGERIEKQVDTARYFASLRP